MMAIIDAPLDMTQCQAGDVLQYVHIKDKYTLTARAGKYRLKCYGAQGGFRSNTANGGQGGYAEGILELTEETVLHIFPGGAGNNGGFNGGGERQNYVNNRGGGASDIRIGTDDLYARAIVAGGGGSDGASSKPGKNGGGLEGVSATESYGDGGHGGAQTSPGNGSASSSATRGSFGIGGTGVFRSSGNGGAGGGSGYVLTVDSFKPDGYLLSDVYYLSDTTLQQGGQTGDGLVIIEVLEFHVLSLILAVDEDGVKGFNGSEWVFVGEHPTVNMFNTYGITELPTVFEGLKAGAQYAYLNTNASKKPKDASLVVDMLTPPQTINQIEPFIIPEGFVVDRIKLNYTNTNAGAVGYEYDVANNEMRFTYTLTAPSRQDNVLLSKVNVYLKESR